MVRIIICKECGEEKEHEAKGLCKRCYKKQHKPPLIICKRCNKKKKHHGKGFCSGCYKRPYVVCKECGEEKEHEAFNLCRKCYNKQRNRNCYDKQHKRPYVVCKKCRKEEEHHALNLCRKCYDLKYQQSEKGRFMNRRKKSRRRLKLKGHINPIGISLETQKKIIKRDKVCVYCCCKTYKKGEEGYTKQKERTIDHIIAIENDGTNSYNNLVLSCYSCNSSKNDKDVIIWCKEKKIEVPKIVIELLNKQKEQVCL